MLTEVWLNFNTLSQLSRVFGKFFKKVIQSKKKYHSENGLAFKMTLPQVFTYTVLIKDMHRKIS
jgi:hypothetical protein